MSEKLTKTMTMQSLVPCALCDEGFPVRDMQYRSGEYLCEECYEVVERITKAREAKG